MEAAAKTFFSSQHFAVAGASQVTTKVGYRVLEWYHEHGLPVTPINPKSSEISLPSKVYKTASSPSTLEAPGQTSLSIVTPPGATKKILEEAKSVGVPAVWLQPGTFDDEGLKYAQENFAAVGGPGGKGSEGWCILVDGEEALKTAKRGDKSESL